MLIEVPRSPDDRKLDGLDELLAKKVFGQSGIVVGSDSQPLFNNPTARFLNLKRYLEPRTAERVVRALENRGYRFSERQLDNGRWEATFTDPFQQRTFSDDHPDRNAAACLAARPLIAL